jgi:hypothetical protein
VDTTPRIIGIVKVSRYLSRPGSGYQGASGNFHPLSRPAKPKHPWGRLLGQKLFYLKTLAIILNAKGNIIIMLFDGNRYILGQRIFDAIG